MNQIELLCESLSKEFSAMRCPDCGKFHHVEVSPLKGETILSSSFPTLSVGPAAEAFDCPKFLSIVRERTTAARKALLSRNGLL